MKHKALRCSVIIAAGLFLAVFFGLAYKNTPQTDAVKATDFNAGRIIDDAVFYNPNTMTVAEIQAHLDRYSANCDMWGEQPIGYGRKINGVAVNPNISRREYARMMREAGRADYHDAPYVCISKYYENPTTHKTNFETNAVAEEGMISAAQIIYNAAHQYNINPQVLLVMLKKESYVWGDTWPLKNEYNTVMGYACPDNAPCDSAYFGFYNQVMKAAWQLNYYKEHIYSYGYYPYMTNNIYYSPNYSCGTKAVYLENIATTSLYIYTPYTPNDAALANYPGEAYCGSYGNRNFFMYFSEWFGSTYEQNPSVGNDAQFSAIEASVNPGKYRIIPANDTAKSLQVVNNQLQVSTRLNNNSDTFDISKYDDGTYKILNVSTSLSIDIPESKAEEDVMPIAFSLHGSNNQHWKFYKNAEGTYSISTLLKKTLVINNENRLVKYDSESADVRFYLVAVDAETVDSTRMFRLASKAINKKYLDIYGGVTSETTFGKVGTFTKNSGESDNQTFNITYDESDGYYRIINSASKLLLSVENEATNNGANIIVEKDNKSCGQKWYLKNKDDGYYIYSVCSDKVLDLNRENGDVNLYTYHGGDNQLWMPEETNLRPLVEGSYIISSAIDNSYTLSSFGYLKDIKLSNSSTDKFKFVYNSYLNYYTIYTDDENVLDVANSATENGANIISFKYHGGCNQRWIVNKNDDNTYSIMPYCQNKNLELWGSDLSKGRIDLWDTHGSTNQRWVIK